MKMARVTGRVFCTQEYENLRSKTLLLSQPCEWDTDEAVGLER